MPESPSPDTPREDTPVPDTEASTARPGGFTLDLSSGEASPQPAAWKRKRKKTSAVFTKVMDLSSPAVPAPEPPPEAPKAAGPKPSAVKQRTSEKRGGARSGGSTLADLLDPETLARLRGEDDA